MSLDPLARDKSSTNFRKVFTSRKGQTRIMTKYYHISKLGAREAENASEVQSKILTQ